MDFSKFRASGDLSDITVFVDGQENKLHKFPLYARSDYFCELARSHPSGESEVSRIDLEDFPGGSEIFEQVADFCYNMPVNMTKNNAVAIRCATEYLKMGGTGNLMEVADAFISDSIMTSKLNSSTAGPVAMLMDCNAYGEIANSAGIVTLCIDALIDCWTRPSAKYNPVGTSSVFKVPIRSKINDVGASSAFTKVQNQSVAYQGTAEKLDEVSINCLISIRPDWFAIFLTAARDRGVAMPELGHLAVRYVSSAMDKDSLTNGNSNFTPGEEASEASRKSNRSEKEADETDVTDTADSPSQPSLNTSDQQVDLGPILDQVILVLPETAYSIPTVTMEWLTKVLRIATTKACKCRCHLVRIAGEMLTHLGPEELCVISPSVLHDIVVDAAAEDSSDPSVQQANKPSIHSERACKLVDTYLGQMSTKGVLTSETFRLLVSATKTYPRTSHDPLYSILESILKTEKKKLSSAQCLELVDLVNFDLLSEPNLQRALDEEVAPPAKIASSSLKLCSKLRSELASVKYIAEMQEEDIQKYQTVAAANVATSLHSKSPTLSSEPRRFTSTLSARERNIDSGFADILEPLPKSPSDHVDSGSDVDKTDPMRTAQSLLSAARHKLAVPMYTGYRPALLTRLSSPSNVSNHSHQAPRGTVEHDISLEEELEFKFDRTFRSLDPRVRQQRLNLRDNPHHHSSTHTGTHHVGSQRSYFPYSSSSYRY